MTKTPAAISRQEERTKRRRAQVLDAARACMLDEGFHAASIGRIAATAAMSAGHIYKYFENKDAIMIALIEHDMDEFMLMITQVDESENRSVDSIIDSFVKKLPSILASDPTALWLEVQAEAGRNPRVQELAVRAAHRFRDTIRTVIEPALNGIAKEELDTRVELLLVTMHGLGLHASVHSEGGLQPLANAVELVFRTALSPASQSVGRRKVKAA